jgi:hypothetical protein
MDFKLDENTLWVLGILALVFFLFPQKKAEKAEVKAEQQEKFEYIYRRKSKERRRLVYG